MTASPSPSQPATGGTSGGNGGGAGGAGGASEATLAIILFEANVSTLTPSDTLTVTAVLAGPVTSGTLVDPNSQHSYGAFISPAPSQSFTISLSWDAINLVNPISGPVAGASRTLRALFFDARGGVVTRDLVVQLACSSAVHPEKAGLAPCLGVCVDLETDAANCGACGNQLSYPRTVCQGGLAQCDRSLLDCGTGDCKNPLTDVANCGRCGHDCREAVDPLVEATCDRTCKYEIGFQGDPETGLGPQSCSDICQTLTRAPCIGADVEGSLCFPDGAHSCSEPIPATASCSPRVFCACQASF
jgi:hypothetical protein